MDTSHLDQPYASALSPSIPSIPSIPRTRESSSSRPSTSPPASQPSIPSIPSIPGTRASSSPSSPTAPADALRPPSHISQKLAELLRKAGSLSASPEAVQAMIDLGAPADNIVKFTAWLEGKLNGSI